MLQSVAKALAGDPCSPRGADDTHKKTANQPRGYLP